MLKTLLPFSMALLLTLTSCGGNTPTVTPVSAGGTLSVVATTYPVYCFACAVTKDVPDVTVSLMIDQPISCLHDYTLSVDDMKTLESADVIVLSGAGLEESMQDALDSVPDTPVIDCSEGVELLTLSEEGETETDPHIWMDPANAGIMIRNLANGLSAADASNAERFQTNAATAVETVTSLQEDLSAILSDISCRELITFHDGFQYFAKAFDLTILRAIEEEAGSEASAKEAAEIAELVKTHNLPAIFTEVNGADATAQLISRETGVPVYPLDLMMSGETENAGLGYYIAGLTADVDTILEACS